MVLVWRNTYDSHTIFLTYLAAPYDSASELLQFTKLNTDEIYICSMCLSCRPLPDEMIKYAREDTHYLLYIYDRMRNELMRRSNTGTDNLLKTVIERSTEICLKVSFMFQYHLMCVPLIAHLFILHSYIPILHTPYCHSSSYTLCIMGADKVKNMFLVLLIGHFCQAVKHYLLTAQII